MVFHFLRRPHYAVLYTAIKELVTDANFVCSEEGIKLQAMDNSHVALVAVDLYSEGFVHYRCDHPMPLGVNLASFTKVLKCAKDDDRVALTATDAVDVLKLTYEAKSTLYTPLVPSSGDARRPRMSRLTSVFYFYFYALIAQDRVSEYEIKLMDIDQETLGIPQTDYDVKITLSAAEFARICRDLQQLGESVRIEVSKEGVRFISEGDAANGSIHLRPAGDKVRSMAEVEGTKKEKVKVEQDEDAPMADDDDSEDGAGEKDDEEEDDENNDEEDSSSKKRKRSTKEEPKRKAKKAKKADDDDDEGVIIAMSQHVSLTFSLKYLANFSKSGSLSNRVSLCMSNDVPLLVSVSPFPAPHDQALMCW